MSALNSFAALVAALAVFTIAPLVVAVPVTDVSGADWDTSGFIVPAGDVVAEDNRPVTFVHTPPDGYSAPDTGPESAVVETTFRSSVLRDPLTQFLTFVYSVDPVGELGTDDGEVKSGSFEDFTTDVTGQFGGPGHVSASRSVDGVITFAAEVPSHSGLATAGVPTLVIATNATQFDRSGSTDFTMWSEFALFDSEGQYAGDSQLSSFVHLSGTFQPAAGPVPVIPLPPAALTGGMMLLAAAATTWRARKARD